MSEASAVTASPALPALPRRAQAVLGGSSLAGLGALSILLCVTAAAGVSFAVPATRRDFTTWLAGPLHGITSTTLTAEQTIIVIALMCACYAGVLRWARSLPARWVIGAIVILHVLFALAPPLISKDIFSYLSYARLGALHGTDPYTHGPFLFPSDPVFRFVAWRHVGSAYGPLFTVGTYPLAFVSVPLAIWSIKVLTALSSLGLIALTWTCARRLGRPPAQAAAFVGLNPILLVYGVGGAHNDLIMLMLMMAAVALALTRRDALAAGSIVLSAAIKATGGVMLPFLFLASRRRRSVVLGGAVALVPLVAMSYAAFHGGALGQFHVLKRQQLLVSGDAIPNQLAHLVGLAGVTSDVRLVARLALLGSLGLLAWHVWRRGLDWVAATGWSMVALVVTSSWMLGWYVLWPLPFAAVAHDRRLKAVALGLIAYFVVMRWTVFIR